MLILLPCIQPHGGSRHPVLSQMMVHTVSWLKTGKVNNSNYRIIVLLRFKISDWTVYMCSVVRS